MTSPRVETISGVVEGSASGAVREFKGIPFAKAPIGTARFRSPEAPRTWAGVLDCTRYRPAAPQEISGASSPIPGPPHEFADGTAVSEDCLYLNVWAPADADGTNAILVWIHGGSFVKGSGASPWIDGTTLAATEGIIVVTVNYRLGVLGSLSWTGDGAPEGNNLLRDQIAALEWVRENIAGFGGDPERVTVGGHSAGAISVCDLLASPAAAGLFRAAISQSGHRSFTLSRGYSDDVHSAFLAEIGVDLDSAGRTRLQTIDAGEILAAQTRLARRLPAPFGPAAGGVLPATVPEVVEHTESAVPLLIGTVTDETTLFELQGRTVPSTGSQLTREVAKLFRHPVDEAAVHEIVAGYQENSRSARGAWSHLGTDREWRLPVRDLARTHAAAGTTVFQYEFARRTEILGGALGACHGLDVPFVFGTLEAAGVREILGEDTISQQSRELADACTRAWGAFVRDLEPSAPDQLPRWAPYSEPSPAVMMIGPSPELRAEPHSEDLERLAALRDRLRPILRDT